MNAIFQRLAEGGSSLRSRHKQLVRKEGRNYQEWLLVLLKLIHYIEGKLIYPLQARHDIKLELPQFTFGHITTSTIFQNTSVLRSPGVAIFVDRHHQNCNHVYYSNL